MDPPPERSIAGTTAFMPRKQPYWLIWMCLPLSGLREQPIARNRSQIAAGRVFKQFKRGIPDEFGCSHVCLEGERAGLLGQQ
jgi:hypothetical protein